jgi:hypothetical protein
MLLTEWRAITICFGMAMNRYREKQFYKKFIDVIEIPPLGHLDLELKLDIKPVW